MRPVVILILVLLSFSAAVSQTRWIRQIGGSGADNVYDIAVDSSGNNYITGDFEESVQIGSSLFTSAGMSDIFLAKLDKDGVILWQKQFGGPDEDFGRWIGADDQGNCYVAARFSDDSITIDSITLSKLPGEGYEVFIAKFDTQGRLQWAKGLSPGVTEVFGFDVNKKGDLIVYGFFTEEMSFDGTPIVPGGLLDFYALCFNANGTLKWGRALNTPTIDFSNFWSIAAAIDEKGNGYLTGAYANTLELDGHQVISNGGNYDLFIAKLNGNGVCTWLQSVARTDVFPNARIAEFGDVIVDRDSDVYVTGSYWRNMTIGTTTLTANSAGLDQSADIFLIKLNPSGEFQWARSLGSSGDDYSYKLAVDQPGNIYLSGIGSNKTIIGSLTIMGSNYPFFAEYDRSGTAIFADKVGETSLNTATMAISPIGGIIYAGGFLGQFIDSDPAKSLSNRSTQAAWPDGFVLKYQLCQSAITNKGVVSGTAEICPGSPLRLQVSPVDGAARYEWQIGSVSFTTTSPSIDTLMSLGANSVNVNVMAVNACNVPGPKSDTFQIHLKSIPDSELIVPNVFTPNGDTDNEYFELDDRLNGCSLKVFNRWGKEVYSSNSYLNNWSGDDLSSGVYFYILKQDCINAIKGVVTILR